MSLNIDDDISVPNVGGDGADAVFKAGEFILHESNKIIPFEEGTLKRSGIVDMDRSEPRARISYDTPYAAVQHEDRSLSHDHGRQAKYLERTIKSKGDKMMDYLEEELGGIF